MLALLFALLAAAAAWISYRLFGRAWFKHRGARLVTCPENHQPAAVKINARHAASTCALGHLDLRLSSCTRWPEKRNCGQECLKQIQESPGGCLIRNIVLDWYAGKGCVLCGKPLGDMDWSEHRPALLAADRSTREWSEIAVETLPSVLATHQPICWRCYAAETFRRLHPELVVDR